jgi:hypothetical protein
MDVNEVIEFLAEMYEDNFDELLYECEMHPYDALRILIVEGGMKIPLHLKEQMEES